MAFFTLLEHADVVTMHPARPHARSILLGGGRVLAVFDSPQPDLVLPDCQRIDLQGRCLMPGFTDAHIHFVTWGSHLSKLDVGAARSADDVAQAIAARLAAQPLTPQSQAEILEVVNWMPNLWANPTLPTSPAWLDAVAPDRPVVLRSRCLHLAWLNSAAMQVAGLEATMADPPGGRLERNEHGQLTGLLLETATKIARDLLPDNSFECRRQSLTAARREGFKLGITGIHSLETLDDFVVFQEAIRDDIPIPRVLFYFPYLALDDLCDLKVQSARSAGFLTIGGIKIFSDGSLGGRTAWMHAPYEGEPGNFGIPIHEVPALRALISRASAAGLACAVHAIGDAAITAVLDAFEAAPRPTGAPLRHRIEHLQTVRRSDLARCAHLGVAASVQATHLMDDWAPALRLLGTERASMTYAFRQARDAGITLMLGSDAPVAYPSVAASLYAAVNRQDLADQPAGGWFAAERLTVAEALEAHTAIPAQFAGDGHQRGVITPGALADLVVLEANPLLVPSAQLKHLRVLATILEGRTVYRDVDFDASGLETLAR